MKKLCTLRDTRNTGNQCGLECQVVYVSGHSVENNKERLVEDVSSCA